MIEDKTQIIIKKYSNRRLYDTATSSYITLNDVRKIVKSGEDFKVVDAKTNENITHQILTQIIFEQELSGKPILPIKFLKRVIELYDDSISELIPHYLDNSIEAFIKNQDVMRSYLDKTWGKYNPIDSLEEIRRQNINLINKTIKIFNPFDGFLNNHKNDDKDKS